MEVVSYRTVTKLHLVILTSMSIHSYGEGHGAYVEDFGAIQ